MYTERELEIIARVAGRLALAMADHLRREGLKLTEQNAIDEGLYLGFFEVWANDREFAGHHWPDFWDTVSHVETKATLILENSK